MPVFIHAADHQLGMTRRFLPPEAQARFTEDRIETVTRLLDIAVERGASFVVLAGDTLDTNDVRATTLQRFLATIRRQPIPVLYLPGNHDALDPGSPWHSEQIRAKLPSNLIIVADEHPIVIDGIEVVGAPWRSRRPDRNPLCPLLDSLQPSGRPRVVIGHGGVDTLSGDHGDPLLLRQDDLERAITEGRAQYIALGDRHSATEVGGDGRIWFSGSPEPTSFRETDPGNILVVDLDGERCKVERVPIGRWRFVEYNTEVAGEQDVEHVLATLNQLTQDPARLVLSLRITGTLPLTQYQRLMSAIDALEVTLGALVRADDSPGLQVQPSDEELAEMGRTSPLMGEVLAALQAHAKSGINSQTVTDAVNRLYQEVRA